MNAHRAQLARTGGEIVEVDGRRMVVTYDPKAPDWFVDEAHREQ